MFSEFSAISLKPAMHVGFQTHSRLCDRRRFRCRYKFTSAKQAHSRSWFFFNPRYLTF